MTLGTGIAIAGVAGAVAAVAIWGGPETGRVVEMAGHVALGAGAFVGLLVAGLVAVCVVLARGEP